MKKIITGLFIILLAFGLNISSLTAQEEYYDDDDDFAEAVDEPITISDTKESDAEKEKEYINPLKDKPKINIYLYKIVNNLHYRGYLDQLQKDLIAICEKDKFIGYVEDYRLADIVISGKIDANDYGYSLSLYIEDVACHKHSTRQNMWGTSTSLKEQTDRLSDTVMVVAKKIYDEKMRTVKRNRKMRRVLEDNPMILIRGGKFEMGGGDIEKDEQPATEVEVKDFYMDIYEVTNYQYRKFIIANPSWQKHNVNPKLVDKFYLYDWNVNDYPEGEDSLPVRYVSWYAARAYAEWLGRRLPTEAEWEYAAGGKENFDWSLGNQFKSQRYAFDKNKPQPVGSYKPNSYGIYDLSGNVGEWCATLYSGYPYKSKEDARDYLSVTMYKDFLKVCRGGSWAKFDRRFLRSANRMASYPNRCRMLIGFRTVKDVEPTDMYEDEPLPKIGSTW